MASFSGYRSFKGNNLDEWFQHFGFKEKMRKALVEDLEVTNVEDLKYVYEDKELVDMLKGQVSKVEFNKFLDIRSLTNPLTSVSSEQKSVTSQPSYNPYSVSMPPMVIAPVAAAPMGKPFVVPVMSSPVALVMPSSSSPLSMEVDDPEPEPVKRSNEMDLSVEELRRKIEEEVRLELESANKRKERELATERRKESIKMMEIRVRHSASLDVVFLIDCTGSMAAYIDAIKNKITEFVENIHKLHPSIALRIAFIGYRDHCDEDRLAVLRFTTSITDFLAMVCCQRATGGGDEAEDIIGGLNIVCSLDWTSETRVLYHVGDAPCHGRQFHGDNCSDNFADGDPHGLKVEDLLQDLRTKNVQYYFGRIRDTTDKMIEQFNLLAGPPAPYIFETPIKASTMMELITKTVTKSMAAAVSSSGRTDDGKISQKVVHLEHKTPAWKDISVENAMRFSMTVPESTAGLAAEAEDRCVNDFPDAMPVSIKMALKPFAKGGLRAAHYGQLINPDNTLQGIILKDSLAAHKKFRTKHDYEKFLVCHRAAKFLAVEFNKVKPRDCPPIYYVEAHILQLMTRWPEQPFVICEGQIPGHFEKYNSNTGYCAVNPMMDSGINHDAVQAFSHWTYSVTKGKLMVVDCQGGFDKHTNTFMLTDPAVHSTNLLQYGRTNLAEKGFSSFFATHVCNGHCRALRLSKPSTGATTTGSSGVIR